MKVLRIITLLILVSRLLAAQSSAPPPATGAVTGHVYLGDSHLPARLTYVTLLPDTAADTANKKQALKPALVQTGLDGAFVIPDVLPGSYYIIATRPGYSLPAPDLNGDFRNLNKAPQDVKDALAVAVAANRVSTANIVLSRGAAIAGTVRFDDGEPASEAKVSLLRKDKSGKWTASLGVDAVDSGFSVDDQGNFRIVGLPAGEYCLRTTLVFRPGTDLSNSSNYHWDIYFGDGIRLRDAKTITVKDGEESNGNNIEIPLAKLHSVSGTVVSLETGMPLGSAHVELHISDDDSLDAEVRVTSGGQFYLPYVAEGEYILKVTEGSDLAPVTHRSGDAKPIRTYADASQPLIVNGETSGVTVQLKPVPVAAGAQ